MSHYVSKILCNSQGIHIDSFKLHKTAVYYFNKAVNVLIQRMRRLSHVARLVFPWLACVLYAANCLSNVYLN